MSNPFISAILAITSITFNEAILDQGISNNAYTSANQRLLNEDKSGKNNSASRLEINNSECPTQI